MVIQGISYPSDFEAKKNMIETGRKMDDKGYVIAAEGSMSVRVGPDSVWVTAGNTQKGALTQENFIRVDMSGKQIPASKKTELPADLAVHLAVYASNPELRGIIHAYPAGAAVLGAMGKDVQPADYTPAVKALGYIPLIRQNDAYGVAMAASDACQRGAGMIAQQDGCFLWDVSLAEAFCKLEALDYYVKVSSMLGGGCAVSAGAKPASTSYAYAAQPAPKYSAPPAAAPAASPDYSEMSGISGLTPIIKPGEKLPAPEEKKPASQANTAPTPAAPSYIPPAAPNTGQPSQQSPPGNASSTRSKAMAEVVRRSLESMK